MELTGFQHVSVAISFCAKKKLSKPIRDIAWKAQERLHCRRYRKLAHAGKLKTVITAAIARELSGFVWAIAKQTRPETA